MSACLHGYYSLVIVKSFLVLLLYVQISANANLLSFRFLSCENLSDNHINFINVWDLL